jgi:hypothetical protein
MTDQFDVNVIEEILPTDSVEEFPQQGVISQNAGEEPAAVKQEAGETVTANGAALNRHVEAGRKGAQRFHQLLEYGKLYEQEHGLKRGRQRLRQLIEQGKLYEQEHGLRAQRTRARRLSHKQVLRRFFDALTRMSRPSYRSRLARIVQLLEQEEE